MQKTRLYHEPFFFSLSLFAFPEHKIHNLERTRERYVVKAQHCQLTLPNTLKDYNVLTFVLYLSCVAPPLFRWSYAAVAQNESFLRDPQATCALLTNINRFSNVREFLYGAKYTKVFTVKVTRWYFSFNASCQNSGSIQTSTCLSHWSTRSKVSTCTTTMKICVHGLAFSDLLVFCFFALQYWSECGIRRNKG